MHIHRGDAKDFRQAPCRNHKRRAAIALVSQRVGTQYIGQNALCRECLDRLTGKPINISLYANGDNGRHLMRKRQDAHGGWRGWSYALVYDDRDDLAYQLQARYLDAIGAP